MVKLHLNGLDKDIKVLSSNVSEIRTIVEKMRGKILIIINRIAKELFNK